MQFITAYRMFLSKKFFGHGINSFRHLCDQAPYTTKDVIKNNNKFFSPIDGYYYLEKNITNGETKVNAFFINEDQKLEFEKISQVLRDSIISKDSSQIFKANENLELFKNNNSIVSFQIHHQILDSIKSPSLLKKGDYVFASSEYDNGCNTHPHNFHLQILSELGLFGYVFLLLFFIYLIFIFFKNLINTILIKNKKKQYNNNLYCVFIILGLIQFLFPIIPSGNIFNNWLSIFFYFNLAFLINILYYNK
jgi:hypothetical protein